MLKEMLLKGYLFWGIAILSGIGIFSKLLAVFAYQRLVRQSENIASGKGKMVQQMKSRFENCYKLNLGVNNIPVFVEKYIGNYKFLGMSAAGIGRFSYKMLLLCGIASLCGCGFGIYYGFSVDWMLFSLLAGGIATLGLMLVDNMAGLELRQNKIKANFVDYLENTLTNRLAHEYAANMVNMTTEERIMAREERAERQREEKEQVQDGYSDEKMNQAAELLEEIAMEQEERELAKVIAKRPKIKKNAKKQQESDNEIIREILSEFLA